MARYTVGDRDVTQDEFQLGHNVGKATLVAACKGLGLPTGGTNIALARRLTEAGLTRATVQERYGRQAGGGDDDY